MLQYIHTGFINDPCVTNVHVKGMLRRGVIQASHSRWASPFVLVRREDVSIHVCEGYCRMINVTRKHVYPLSRIDASLDSLHRTEFSSIDLRSGCWQVPMAEADSQETDFFTPDGLYEFNVTLLGFAMHLPLLNDSRTPGYAASSGLCVYATSTTSLLSLLIVLPAYIASDNP